MNLSALFAKQVTSLTLVNPELGFLVTLTLKTFFSLLLFSFLLLLTSHLLPPPYFLLQHLAAGK
jgi:hypothetical protein